MAKNAQITLWHNPRCSKSRIALRLLRERGFEPDIFEYLKARLKPDMVREVLNKLGMEPQELMRKKESIYRELNLKNMSDEDELIKAMVYNPILIERPILIVDDKAAIGRPSEKVLSII